MNSVFNISLLEISWISKERTEYDLCAHGNVRVNFGEKIILSNMVTISATALLLLRTLEKEHTKENPVGEFLLPCCGHFLIYEDNMKEVYIVGCSSGDDWEVIHKEDYVLLSTQEKHQIKVNFDHYKTEVLNFVDVVETFYKESPKKIIPDDDFDRRGYLRFWEEWAFHRKKWT